MRPVTIYNGEVEVHGAPATTNSGSASSSASSSPDGRVVTHGAADRDVRTFTEAARAIHLWLQEFCDPSLVYPAMIAEAARRAEWAINSLRNGRDIDRAAIDELSARLATVEAERDRLRELGGDHLITALAFLAGHHDRKRAEAADAIHSRVTDEEIANCERHVAHHTEQLYQIGELTALLGGRNAYPRPGAPTTGDTP